MKLRDGEGKPARETALKTLSATRPSKETESKDIRSVGGCTGNVFLSPKSNSGIVFVVRAGCEVNDEFKFSSIDPRVAVGLAEMEIQADSILSLFCLASSSSTSSMTVVLPAERSSPSSIVGAKLWLLTGVRRKTLPGRGSPSMVTRHVMRCSTHQALCCRSTV